MWVILIKKVRLLQLNVYSIEYNLFYAVTNETSIVTTRRSLRFRAQDKHNFSIACVLLTLSFKC